MERAVALAQHDKVVLEDLPDRIRTNSPSKFIISAEDSADFLPIHEVERRYILRVLAAFGGNKRQAAISLGLDRKTLWRKLKLYNYSG
jgi:two-component system response regulator HydG